MKKYAALPVDEERRLGELARAGDAEAHRKLWDVALRLVPYCVSKMRRAGYMLHSGLAADDDMLQEGYLCIGPALLRWDPAKGRMSSFLMPRIRGALLDWAAEVHKGGIASKHTACTVLDMEETIVDGEFEPQDQPGLHAQASGATRMDMLTYEGIYGPAGLDPASASPNAQAAERAQDTEDLLRMLSMLPEETADVVRLAYGIGCAQLLPKEIGKLTGQSTRTVYRILSSGVAQMANMWRDYK